jgi:hypothetical protein
VTLNVGSWPFASISRSHEASCRRIMAERRWRRCFPDLWLCPLLGKADVRADMAISTRVTRCGRNRRAVPATTMHARSLVGGYMNEDRRAFRGEMFRTSCHVGGTKRATTSAFDRASCILCRLEMGTTIRTS